MAIRARKTANFSVISNTILTDTRLSWEARGVAAYILSKSDGWVVRTSQLITQSPTAGRDRILRIMQELEKYRYLVRVTSRRPDGRYEFIQDLFEEPQPENGGSAGVGEAPSGLSRPEKALTLLNTDRSNTDLINTDPLLLAAPQKRRRGRVAFAPLRFEEKEFPEGSEWFQRFLRQQETFTTPECHRLLMNWGWWEAMDKEIGEIIEPEFIAAEFAAMKRWLISNPKKAPTENNILRFIGSWLRTAAERARRRNEVYQGRR